MSSAIDPSLLLGQQQASTSGRSVKQEEPAEGQVEGDSEMQMPDDSNGASTSQAAAGTSGVNGVNGTDIKPGQLDVQEREPDEPAPPALDLRDDAELAALLAKMEDYDPILPDPVTRFYLEKAGFQSSDDRVTRMLGLAAQKFVSDIARDAYAFARTRTAAGPGRTPGAGTAGTVKAKDRQRTVLTMEDLSAALHEYGIDAARAPYYR